MEIKAQHEKIRPGYKQTEVGVIPDDWQPQVIGDVVLFSGGSQPPRSTFSSTRKNGYLRLIQIRDYKTDEFATYIPEPLVNKRCLANDIMIGRYGPPIFQILRGLEGAYNVALIKAIPSALIDREYLFHFLKQDVLFRFVEALSQRSSGQTGIEMPALKRYGLPLPTLPEQRAIATALSDVDVLIASLDNLIIKKRDLKQAVMQQLLTGKERLAGFSGEWEMKQLGDIGVFRGGSGFPTRYQGAVEGEFPFFKVSDMNNDGNSTFMVNSNNWISENVREAIRATVFPSHSIVFAKIGAAIFLERKKILSRASCIDNNMMGFIPDETLVHHVFIHYLFLSMRLGKLVSTTALPSLNGNELAKLKFLLPLLDEQIAIASILSDMDAEIAALEQRRDKTLPIKQGMMQELLTGKTRLI